MEPLILWEDPEGKQEPISVDNMLVKFLRPHQREAESRPHLVHWSIDWSIDWTIHWSIDWTIHWTIHWSNRSFIRSTSLRYKGFHCGITRGPGVYVGHWSREAPLTV